MIFKYKFILQFFREKKFFFIPSFLLILVLILIGYGYKTLRRETTSALLARRGAVAELAAMVLEEKFSRLKDIGFAISTRIQFQKFVSKGKWEDAIENMRSVPKEFPYINMVLLTDARGTVMADFPRTSMRGKNLSTRDWYKGIKRSGKPYLSLSYSRTGERSNAIIIASPIKTENGKTVGVLVLQVPLEALIEWTKQIEVGQEGALFFVDPEGNSIGNSSLTPQSDEFLNLSDYFPAQQALAGKRNIIIYQDPIKHQELVIAHAPVGNYGWGVIVQQPKKIAFAQRNKTLSFFTVVSFSIFFMTCLATYILIRIILVRQKRNEDRLRELISIKSEFTSMVSHELRTPLTVMKEGVSMVVDGTAGPVTSSQKECLEAAERNIERLERLINDVLDYQKLDAGEISLHLEQHDINAIIENISPEILSFANQKKLKIVQKLAKNLPKIFCDRDKLVQVLLNLVNNAVKFSEKGTITIQTEKCENVIRVAVCDEGVGIAQEDLSKLFQSFVQLKQKGMRKTGGSGLGLAICRKIVEMHHGTVGVESVYGKGSTFWFCLPS